jgi:hypothetical protein
MYNNGDRVADTIKDTDKNYYRRGTVIGPDPKNMNNVIVEWDQTGYYDLSLNCKTYLGKKPIIELMSENDAALKETNYELRLADVKEKIKSELDLAADALSKANLLAIEAGLQLNRWLGLSEKFAQASDDIGLESEHHW